jgi:hypothetical protein
MSPLDPLYSVACERCGRAYLGRVEDLVDNEGGCPVCRGSDARASRVPDEEDIQGDWRLLSMDALEHSARLALRSARLRERSDSLLHQAKDALAAAPR